MTTCHTPYSDHSDPAFVSLTQRLIEALGRLQSQAPSAISGSIYIYDLIEQRSLYASCSVATMLGYTANEIHAMGSIGLASLIHPADLQAVSEYYQRFTTLRAGKVMTISYRMKRADGSWCWLRSHETPLVQASDRLPLQILGIIEIISQPFVSTPVNSLYQIDSSKNMN